MVDADDRTDDSPRPARPAPKKAASRKAAPKKAGSKKAAPKKAAPKKAAPKKAAPKKAASRKAAPKKAAPKKAVPKKASPKTAGSKKQRTRGSAAATDGETRSTEHRPPAALRPLAPDPADHDRTVPTTERPARVQRVARVVAVPDPSIDAAPPGRWAVCASFTEQLLNDLIEVTVGDGVALEPLDTSVALPAMGEVDVRLALTITGGRFDLRADDGGRCRIVVTADGDVSTRSVAYDVGPVDEHSGPTGMPAPPAPIPVRVEALVRPFVEIRSHDEVAVGLDLADAELISLAVDADAPIPPDVDPVAWTGVLNMFSMMFGVLGAGLFESLGEHVGSAGIELGPEVGRTLEELGVRPGRAEVSVASGLVTVGLAAADSVEGRAWPVPVAGSRVGIGAASSVVDVATRMLLARAAGDLPMPFELDVDLGEQQVSSRVRSSRLLPDGFPDLRSAVRTEIRPRLVRGRLELDVRAAWVELPSIVGSVLNPLSRRLGDLAALAPMRIRFPAELGLPIAPGGAPVPVCIDDLRIGTDGLGLVLTLP